MPIEVGLWRIGERLKKVDFSPIDSESRLESVLAEDISVIHPGLLLIGRQVPTAYGKFIDLLALDGDGHVVVLELKKNRTPREVVAQLLDYGSWVRQLDDEDIASLFDTYVKKHDPQHGLISLDQAFCDKFGVKAMPETLNESHELVLVAGELDDSSERIIGYLADEYGVSINAVFFRFFRDGDHEYISRAWLADPGEVEKKVVAKREKEPWNGEYYACFGDGLGRAWEDGRKYGFTSAGGGLWYSRTLSMLEPGGRVWVNVSGGVGYVGVGIVEACVVPMDKFLVDDGSGNQVPISSQQLNAHYHQKEADENPDNGEFFVKVRWLKTVPTKEAVKEKGFFGNQNSAAQPRAKKWQHTIERLRQRFDITD